jgi:AbrB family looped-hinge helix DNA binding protein
VDKLQWQVFGTSTLGERGQLVVPSEARKRFDMAPGDRFVVLGAEEFGTVALVKADVFSKLAESILSQASILANYNLSLESSEEAGNDAAAV